MLQHRRLRARRDQRLDRRLQPERHHGERQRQVAPRRQLEQAVERRVVAAGVVVPPPHPDRLAARGDRIESGLELAPAGHPAGSAGAVARGQLGHQAGARGGAVEIERRPPPRAGGSPPDRSRAARLLGVNSLSQTISASPQSAQPLRSDSLFGLGRGLERHEHHRLTEPQHLHHSVVARLRDGEKALRQQRPGNRRAGAPGTMPGGSPAPPLRRGSRRRRRRRRSRATADRCAATAGAPRAPPRPARRPHGRRRPRPAPPRRRRPAAPPRPRSRC